MAHSLCAHAGVVAAPEGADGLSRALIQMCGSGCASAGASMPPPPPQPRLPSQLGTRASLTSPFFTEPAAWRQTCPPPPPPPGARTRKGSAPHAWPVDMQSCRHSHRVPPKRPVSLGIGPQIKSNQIKSNQIKSNQIKSNQIPLPPLPPPPHNTPRPREAGAVRVRCVGHWWVAQFGEVSPHPRALRVAVANAASLFTHLDTFLAWEVVRLLLFENHRRAMRRHVMAAQAREAGW